MKIPVENSSSFGVNSYASILMSSFCGGAIAGPIGAATGCITSLIDAFLITQKQSEKHYMSTGTFWASTVVKPAVDFFLPSLSVPVSITASLVTGLGLSYLSTDFLDFSEKLDLPIESFFMINKMFDDRKILSSDEGARIITLFKKSPAQALIEVKKDIEELYQNEFFCTFVKSTATSLFEVYFNYLFISYLATYSKNLYIVNLLTNHQGKLKNLSLKSLLFLDNKHVKNLVADATKVISIYFAKALFDTIFEVIQNTVSVNQYQIVLKKSNEILTTGHNGTKVSEDPKGSELIKNLTPDLTKLIYRGSDRVKYVLRDSYSAYKALLTISTIAPDAIAAYAMSLIPTQYALQYISKQSMALARQLAHHEIKFWDIKFDIAKNIKTIDLRNGHAFAQNQYSQVLDGQSSVQKALNYYDTGKKAIEKINEIFAKVIDTIYFGTKFANKQIEIGQIPIIKQSLDDISGFILSNLNLQINNKEVTLAKERLDQLFSIISRKDSHLLKRTKSDHNAITLRNYALNLGDKKLVSTDQFVFEEGKRYAITGYSGCGKSSTLRDLKQGVFGELNSSGEIVTSYQMDKASEVYFIDQNVYFPTNVSLFEAACFPKILSQFSQEEIVLLREKVVLLFKEFNIDSFVHLDSDNGLLAKLDSTSFVLSGGQEKKVAIIQAIINNPKVLIMDETFVGLDPQSLQIVQDALKKYLPNTMILVVDHTAHNNTSSEFYNSFVSFDNHTITKN